MRATRKLTMAQAISEGITMEMHATRIYSSWGKTSASMSKAATTRYPRRPTRSRSDRPGARAGRDLTIVAPAVGRIEKTLVQAGGTFARGKPIALLAEAP